MLSTRIARTARLTGPVYGVGDAAGRLKSGGSPAIVTWSGPVLFASGNWLISPMVHRIRANRMQEMFPEENAGAGA